MAAPRDINKCLPLLIRNILAGLSSLLDGLSLLIKLSLIFAEMRVTSLCVGWTQALIISFKDSVHPKTVTSKTKLGSGHQQRQMTKEHKSKFSLNCNFIF